MAGRNKDKQQEAERLYRSGEKLVDIAHKLDVPEGTVRRWKSTHKWGSDKSERSDTKKGERSLFKSSKKKTKKEPSATEIDRLCENGELTDKQRLFCIYQSKYFNAGKAYQKAYGCSYETAMTNGSRLLRNAQIKTEVENLKQGLLNRKMISEHDIFQKYMDIAFADMTDYVEFGNKEIEILNDVTGEPEKIRISYVNIKDSTEVDGTIVSEVSKGKDGVKVKLADRMQALKWLADHMDLATEEQRARIDALKAKTATDSGGSEVDDWIAAVLGEDVGSHGQ